MNHQNKARMTHPNPKRNIVPTSVLTRSGQVLVNTTKQNLSKAAVLVNTDRPINTAVTRPKVNAAKQMPNTLKRHIHMGSRVNTARHTVRTARPKAVVNAAKPRVAVKTARPKAVLKAVRGNLGNAVKASAYLVWRPKQKVIDHGNPELELKERGIFDSGCSRHMTGNKSYLTDFEEIDGGFVAFGGNSRGGKITGKDFKLADENHVLLKGKQHRASCKAKAVSSICQPLQMLHMDLFDPTFVKSLMKKTYCLVVTDDFSRFTWVFFLATKDETSGILKSFITGIENLIDLKVKIIRSDNGTEFKNRIMNEFCEMKGIRREYSIARTPQQNGIAERKNRTLIEAARTMLADSKLPTTF
ncbi:putative ribonuclease H-like domain-containing protein [Tanacetum coccineum]